MKIPSLLFLFAGLASCFTEYQLQSIRQQMINHKGPPGSVIVDGVLTSGDFAFTNQVQMMCHIDAARFQCCPNSFANTVIHEIHHLLGRQHNTKFVKDDPMSYAVAIRPTGEVIEDAYVLPPMNPNQPWATQFYGQKPTAPMLLPPAQPPMLIAPTQPPMLLAPAQTPMLLAPAQPPMLINNRAQVVRKANQLGTYLPLPSVTIKDSRATYDPFPDAAFVPTPSVNVTNLSASG